MSLEALQNDVEWIKSSIAKLDGKMDTAIQFQREHLVTKDDCLYKHAGCAEGFTEHKEEMNRRFDEKASKAEFNPVRLLVYGYTATLLAFMLRAWLQQWVPDFLKSVLS